MTGIEGTGRTARHVTRVLVAACLAATLTACGGGNGSGIFGGPAADREQSLEAFTPEQIFQRGEFELERGRTDDAAYFFSEIERLYLDAPSVAWQHDRPDAVGGEAAAAE